MGRKLTVRGNNRVNNVQKSSGHSGNFSAIRNEETEMIVVKDLEIYATENV